MPTPHHKMARKARSIYPLDITSLGGLITTAKRETGIRSKAELMRQAIKVGLPILTARFTEVQK